MKKLLLLLLIPVLALAEVKIPGKLYKDGYRVISNNPHCFKKQSIAIATGNPRLMPKQNQTIAEKTYYAGEDSSENLYLCDSQLELKKAIGIDDFL